MTEWVVLACSGGRDTSVALGWTAAETGAGVVESDHNLTTYAAADPFHQSLAEGFGGAWGPSEIAASRDRRVAQPW